MNFELVGEITAVETIAAGKRDSRYQAPSEELWEGQMAKDEGRSARPPPKWAHQAGGITLV